MNEANRERATLLVHGPESPLVDLVRTCRRIAGSDATVLLTGETGTGKEVFARFLHDETFAEHRVRGAMLDEMRRMDHLPRRLRAGVERIDRARARLAQSLGREPDPLELSGEVGESPEDVAEALQLLQPAVPVNEELLHDGAAAPDEALASGQARRRLAAAIAELPERLRILLARYYDEGLTYREIARVMGVSEPRVCQLHSDAVKRLRGALAES